MALSALKLKAGVRLEDLSTAAQERLLALDEELSRRKLTGTVTSGKRSGGPRSHHHTGDAVDIVLPGDMGAHATALQGLGYTAEFERKGQRNPNGSVATGDHVHITLRGGKPADPYAVYRTASAAPAGDDPYALYRTASAPAKPAAADPYAVYRTAAPTRKTGGKAETGALMDSLLRGEHLAPGQPAPAAAPQPTAAKPKAGGLQWVSSLSNAYAAFENEIARQTQKYTPEERRLNPMVTVQAVTAALEEARRAFGPEAVKPEHFRILYKAKKGTTDRATHNMLATLDYATHIASDPTNVVAGPVFGLAGKGLKATANVTGLTKFGGAVAEGSKAQIAFQKAKMARDAASATMGTLAAKGLKGSPDYQKAAAKYGQAQAALLATERDLRRLGAVGRAASTTAKMAKPAVAAERHVAAHLRREASKLEQIILDKTVGLSKVGLLTRPSTVVANTVGNVAAAEGELARHGYKLGHLGQVAAGAKRDVAAFRNGQLLGDAAELEQHAPGILGTLVQQTLGTAKKTKNPLLEAQSYVDQVMKVSVYKVLKQKLGPAEAAKRVKTALFDYSDRPAILQALDKYGLWLFNGFTTAATKSFVDTLVSRPDLIARYPRLQQQLFQEFPGSEKAYKQLKAYQRSPFTVPTGQDASGTHTFVDLGRFHPWAMPLALVESVVSTAKGEGFRPAGEGSLLETTIFSPSERAAKRTPENAPVDEAWKIRFMEELQGRIPVVKDYLRVRAALQGRTMTDRKTDTSQSALMAGAQALAGVSQVRGETLGESKKRTAAAVNQRAKATRGIEEEVDRELAAGLVNPYVAKFRGLDNFDEAKRQLTKAKQWYRDMLLSGKNTNGKGQVVSQRRIRDAYLRMKALAARVNEIADEMR